MPVGLNPEGIAIRDVTVLTLDEERRIITDGCLIIRDDRIVSLGKQKNLSAEYAKSEMKIEGRGMVVMPGLVNAHTHTFQSLLRGLAEGMDLLGFLKNLIYPVTRVITEEHIRIGATLSVLAAIKSGTTCLIDNHSANTSQMATGAIAQVFKTSGIRGMVARGFRLPTQRAIDWGVPEHVFQYDLATELKITRDLIESWKDKENGRVKICPAPLTLFLSTKEDLQAAKDLADEYNVPLHIHVAETQSEVEATLEDHGVREVELLAEIGVLDERCHIVHGVWLNEHELDLVAEANAHIIHNPVSNMVLGSGIAPVPEMLAREISVALGSDGIGNFNHDMFSVMKIVPLLQRVHHRDPQLISADKVLEMATSGGARALGLEKEIGSLEEGKKADLLLIDLESPHLVPTYDIPATLVFGANGADVDTVIVDGKVIMQNRRLNTLNEESVLLEANTAGRELIHLAGIKI